ncbi:hypothetical protein [Shinella zoogloeoides]|uniref:hypothetical protein n=1 Tax=Shinella zoogloeoides TaxID=352475 RepID=UPI0028A8A572|nr:hypothetical protein [Shinella zoogloeoides]
MIDDSGKRRMVTSSGPCRGACLTMWKLSKKLRFMSIGKKAFGHDRPYRRSGDAAGLRRKPLYPEHPDPQTYRNGLASRKADQPVFFDIPRRKPPARAAEMEPNPACGRSGAKQSGKVIPC